MLDAVPERPKIADAPLSLVLLAQPGQHDCDGVVSAWLDWLTSRPGAAEVLLVVDSDADTTFPTDPRLRIIRQVSPIGEGPCLQTAIWLAQHPLFLTAPCDWQVQPHEAQGLLDQIDKVDLVVGCRVSRPPPVWLRTLGYIKRLLTLVLLGYAGDPRMSWLGWRGLGRRLLVRHVFGLRLQDAQSPFRLYRTDVLRGMPIQSRGGFVHVEILAKANHLVRLMVETAVPWASDPREPDNWAADAKVILKRPEFGVAAVLLPAGVPSGDLLASEHASKSGITTAPDELGG